ncbi:magnesium chelatase domain-containing protein [Neobacillus sp. C211]|uniref:magnesium chelatase domain-containing protein n=1 Tax=unclassified Neobacillus TaxID=2675272 RepID=UPI00397D78D9
MWAKVTSIGLKGMEGYRVHVEVGSYVGNDSFKIVGLPDAAVKESKDRIIAALRTLGYHLSGQKIIINLSPADQKKYGSMFDFPMAIAVLQSLHELEVIVPEDTGFLGSLSLDGSIQPVEGMLPAVLAAKKLGIHKLYMPFDEELPVLDLKPLEIIYVSSLQDAIGHLSGQWIPPFNKKQYDERFTNTVYLDNAADYWSYRSETCLRGSCRWRTPCLTDRTTRLWKKYVS